MMECMTKKVESERDTGTSKGSVKKTRQRKGRGTVSTLFTSGQGDKTVTTVGNLSVIGKDPDVM